jgi:hypothetical protein
MKPCLGWFSFISFLFCEFSAFLVHQGKLGKRGARQKRERERERERGEDDDEVFLFFFLP